MNCNHKIMMIIYVIFQTTIYANLSMTYLITYCVMI